MHLQPIVTHKIVDPCSKDEEELQEEGEEEGLVLGCRQVAGNSKRVTLCDNGGAAARVELAPVGI